MLLTLVTIAILLVTGVRAREKMGYTVTIYTDWWDHAITRDKVHMVIIGSHASTSNITLQDLNRRAFKKPGAVDEFMFQDADIGILKGVRITKQGSDRFIWRGIVVTTEHWNERLETPDYQFTDQSYDHTFYVAEYKGCLENTYWSAHHARCTNCPYKTCSLPGATTIDHCSPGACQLISLKEQVHQLARTVEATQRTDRKLIAELDKTVTDTTERLDRSMKDVRESLGGTERKVQENRDLLDGIKQDVTSGLDTLKEQVNKDVTKISESSTENKNNLKKLSSKVDSIDETSDKNHIAIGDLSKSIANLATNFSSTAVETRNKLSDLASDLMGVKSGVEKNMELIGKSSEELSDFKTEFGKMITETGEALEKLNKTIQSATQATATNKELINGVQTKLTDMMTTFQSKVEDALAELKETVELNTDMLDVTGRFIYRSSELDEKAGSDSGSGITFPIPGRHLIRSDDFQLSGYLRSDRNTFSVTFKSGKDSTVALRITFQYTGDPIESSISLDSFIGGSWTTATNLRWPSSLEANSEFTLKVGVDYTGYHVEGAGLSTVYRHLVPLDTVTRVRLSGSGVWYRAKLIRFSTYSKNIPWNADTN